MDNAVAIWLGIAIGLVAGLAIIATVRWYLRAKANRELIGKPLIPEGVEDLLTTLPQTAIIVDSSYNVLRASEKAYDSGLVVKPDVLAASMRPLVDGTLNNGNPHESQITVLRGPFGSTELHFRVRVSIMDGGYALVLANDITESARVEAVRRDFVANVSHELKTPIGAITLLAEAVKEAADDVEQVQYFADRMLVESDRLARLTRELIDLSRLQAMDTLEEAEDVRVRGVLEQAIELNRVLAENKDIEVQLKAGDDLAVWGDESLLLMCFQNLITNAITYSPEGSHVGIGARRVNDIVEISVADRGIGISEADRGRIFERFYRVDSARSRNTGGTGLGLSIVRHVIQNHGGEIQVWSKLGAGSTFTVRLQAADSRVTGPAANEHDRESD
nr:ATP-binding protein [Pseudoclavibacter sp. Marseille-Q3772]